MTAISSKRLLSSERGAIQLLLVIALLGASMSLLLTAFSSTSRLLSQAQLQHRYAQQFWMAEAGLECIYTQLRSAGAVTHQCGLSVVDIQLTSKSYGTEVQVQVGSVKLTKSFSPTTQRWIAGSWRDF